MRAPQGLSSSGDHFNATTDQFFSGLGDWLIKQVDDMYIIVESSEEFEPKMPRNMAVSGASPNSMHVGVSV